MTSYSLNPFAPRLIDPQQAIDSACHILRFTAENAAVEDYLTGKIPFITATEVYSDHIFELRPNKDWLIETKRTHDLKNTESNFEFTVERDEFGPMTEQEVIYDADYAAFQKPRWLITPLPGTASYKRWGMVLDTNYLAHPFWPAVDATMGSLADAAVITTMAIASRGAVSNQTLPQNSYGTRLRGTTLTTLNNGTEVLASLEESRVAAKFTHPIPSQSQLPKITQPLMITNGKSGITIPTAPAIPTTNPISVLSASIYADQLTQASKAAEALPDLARPLGHFSYAVVPSDTEMPLENSVEINPLPIKTDPTDSLHIGEFSASSSNSRPTSSTALFNPTRGGSGSGGNSGSIGMRDSLFANPLIIRVDEKLQFDSLRKVQGDAEATTLTPGELILKGHMKLALPADTLVLHVPSNLKNKGQEMVIAFTADLPISLKLQNNTEYHFNAQSEITVNADGSVTGELIQDIDLITVLGHVEIAAGDTITVFPDGQVAVLRLSQNLVFRQTTVLNPNRIEPINGMLQAMPETLHFRMQSYNLLSESPPEGVDLLTYPDLVVYPDGAIEGTLAERYGDFQKNARVYVLSDGSLVDAVCETQ